MSQRDLRVDVVRGLALLIIFTDHVRGSIFAALTPINFGFSDMADVFLFLSGYVCAFAYGRVLAERGLGACQRKAVWRAGQLYAAHLATVLVVIAIYRLADRLGRMSLPRSFDELRSTPWFMLRELALLRYLPGNFEILPLYCLLLLPLPLVLLASRRQGWAILLASLALYVAVQLFPDQLQLSERWDRVWLFNPWAWQFPFYVGVAAGIGGAWRRWLLPESAAAVFAAFCVLQATFLLKVFAGDWNVPLVGKANCEPLRMVHFWALVIFGRWLLPRTFGPALGRLLSPITLSGRNALATYCAGGVLSTIGSLVLAWADYSLPWQIAVNVAGWLGCIGAAAASDAWKRGRKSQAAPVR
jgi:hypothetical protein